MVLNADQQLTVYQVKAQKKGGVKLEKQRQLCLYLDEIIDVRIIEEED